MTLDEAIQEFEFDCKIRHLSPKTIDNYKKQLRYFERFLANELSITSVEDVKPSHDLWQGCKRKGCPGITVSIESSSQVHKGTRVLFQGFAARQRVLPLTYREEADSRSSS